MLKVLFYFGCIPFVLIHVSLQDLIGYTIIVCRYTEDGERLTHKSTSKLKSREHSGVMESYETVREISWVA